MIGCLRTRVHKQPIIVLYFEFETVLKFYNLQALFKTARWKKEYNTYGHVNEIL